MVSPLSIPNLEDRAQILETLLPRTPPPRKIQSLRRLTVHNHILDTPPRQECRTAFGPQRLISELHVVKRHSLTRNDQQEEKRFDEKFVHGPSCALLSCPVKHLHTGCARDVEAGRQPRFPLSQQLELPVCVHALHVSCAQC